MPGSGKSSTAQFLCDQLQRSGLKSRWYYEQESAHPVALRYDLTIHKTPTDYFSDCLAAWRSFVSQAMQSDEVRIFDAAFFDPRGGPIEVPLIRTYIHELEKVCQCLDPVLLYFFQSNYSQTMRRICNQRGEHLERFYIEEVEQSLFGKRRGLRGFDGLVRFWEEHAAMEERIIEELDITKLSINNSKGEWSSHYRQICDFLSVPFSAPYAPSEDYLSRFVGTYTYLHKETVRVFTIRLENGDLVLLNNYDFPWLWPSNRLIPKEDKVFYIASFPFEMTFEEDSMGVIRSMRGENPPGNWNILDQVFPKVR